MEFLAAATYTFCRNLRLAGAGRINLWRVAGREISRIKMKRAKTQRKNQEMEGFLGSLWELFACWYRREVVEKGYMVVGGGRE